jgi:HAD superfamily hydrolase (TIGR01484 family)
MVASDIDGTLLAPMGLATDRTVAAVAGVVATGTPFVLATGRPARWIPQLARRVGLSGYAVCANGAVQYDIGADRVITAHLLTTELLGEIVHALRAAVPGIGFAAERIGVAADDLGDEGFVAEDAYRHPWPDASINWVSTARIVGRAATKILARAPRISAGELTAVAYELLGSAVTITYSSGSMVEIACGGVTKATGLAEIAELIDADASGAVAFGDMPNDVPMLSWAGHGVAMGNAHPDVIAAADEVTHDNTEDGVAAVLERWFRPVEQG